MLIMGGSVGTQFYLPLLPDQVSHPNELDPTYFPQLGVTVSFLSQFIQTCIGTNTRDSIKDLTTNDICEKYVKPFTAPYKLSLCDLLQQCGETKIGAATVFISHAWKYKFIEVVDALERSFANSMDTVVWFDVFSVNQHSTGEKTFDWWSTTFQEAIRKFGRTVMILSPWHDPIPLTRAWCLWELYSTFITGCQFEVAFGAQDEDKFFEELTQQSLDKMKATIDVNRSECFVPSDRVRIFEAIAKQTSCSALNAVVFERLREWMIDYLTERQRENPHSILVLSQLGLLHYNQGNDTQAIEYYDQALTLSKLVCSDEDGNRLSLMNNLATIYTNVGQFGSALTLYRECLEVKKRLHDEEDPSTLLSINNIALLYLQQGEYPSALSLYQEYLPKYQVVFGQEHSNTLTLMNNLAGVYENLDMYELAIPLHRDCYEKRRVGLGERHPDTLTSLNNLAGVYMKQEQFGNALPLLQQCVETRKMVHGESHIDTIEAMMNLAACYDRDGQGELALPLYLTCVEKRKALLGQNHRDTVAAMDQLAACYDSQGQYNLAEGLYNECIEKKKLLYGMIHEDTLSSVSGLAMLLANQGKYVDAYPRLQECLAICLGLFGEYDAETLAYACACEDCQDKM